MAKDQASGGPVAGSVPGAAGGNGGRKKPVRKVYDHELTAAENFALQGVQRAAAALKVVNDAIRSGTAVSPKIVELCHEINKAAGDMLFSKPV